MKNKRSAVISCLTLSLLTCLQVPLAAFANHETVLSPEQAVMDSTPPPPPATQQSAGGSPQTNGERKTTFLNGEVKKEGEAAGDPQFNLQSKDSTFNLEATDAGADLKAEGGAAAANPMFQLALQKLADKQPLTAEEYRSLNIGVLGYETTRKYFTNDGIVDAAYPGLPAYEAGIRVGDFEIFDTDDSEVKDPTRPSWMFSCGIAGQPLDVTIRHGKEIQKYHLIRMNMEDIPDARLRKVYEKLVQKLGSQPGTYTIDSNPTTPKAVSILKLLFKL